MYNSSGSPCQLKMSTDHLKHSVSLGIGIALVRHSIPSVRGAGRQCSACESSGPNGTKWRRLPQGTHLSDVRQALGCLYGGLVGLQEGDHLSVYGSVVFVQHCTWLAFSKTTLLEAKCEQALCSEMRSVLTDSWCHGKERKGKFNDKLSGFMAGGDSTYSYFIKVI